MPDEALAAVEDAAVQRAVAQRASRKAQRRGRALQRAAFLAERAGVFDERALSEAMARRLAADEEGAGDDIASALPGSDVKRWVPIGPSVVRRGQAEGRPRVTGRIRDVQLSADGRRAYAASAKGGVWYSDDAGASWSPVGGWSDRAARAGGNNNAKTCGCLLAHFGATPADDYLLVGTGETIPWTLSNLPVRSTSKQGGVGILAAAAPGTAAVGAAVWEPEAGIAQLEGLGVFRMARHPASVPGKATGADADRVVAATSGGLFLGTRAMVGGNAQWAWAKLAGLDTFVGGVATATDVLWLPGGANGRLVVAVYGRGVAISDTLGAAGGWRWITGLTPSPLFNRGRMSIAGPIGTRVYVLGERTVAGTQTPTLWQVADVTIAAPAATVVAGVPANLWGTQIDYDQCVAVLDAAGTDRVFFGGSTVKPFGTAEWSASLWCFDVGAGPALNAAPGISQVGVPTTAASPQAGADVAGLIGNNVHADMHVIRLVRPPGTPPDRVQVWVGCDGGVFCSALGGRVNTFAARAVGLATLEPGYIAHHPGSAHYVAMGAQDNGTQVRTGDTVWEEVLVGDGGGLTFHPVRTDYLVAQYLGGVWLGRPTAGFRDPLNRVAGGSYARGRESGVSSFYSGPAAVRASATQGRIAIGTNRVWLSDDVGGAFNTWGVIPQAAGTVVDANPLGTDPVAQQAVGVPVPAMGPVVQLRWVSPTELLALYASGIVRHVENPTTNVWTSTVLVPGAAGGPTLASNLMTDIWPIAGTQDFYVTCVGNVTASAAAREDTCWFYEQATNTLHPTGLRQALDGPGTPPVPVGPLDPAYAVVVDPAATTDVYVGTVTGVWKGLRAAPTGHLWSPFVNGLPQATVQDLALWTDPAGAAGAPRLLRAAVQSRGLWEVRLDADEVQQTYVRVHARDDRRVFPTPMANARRAPGATPHVVHASPDIVVRPRANPVAAPAWQLGSSGKIFGGSVPHYQLWTFQTAFRWHYPSLPADGVFSDQLGDLIELHRAKLGLSAGRFIDQALWNAVVGGTRLDASGAVSTTATDPLAVYRAPWQSPAALDALATEVDLMESVVPRRDVGDVWEVFSERCTVDVLIHHRDTRPLNANDAFVTLLWRSGPSATALLASAIGTLPAYAASLLTGTPMATPAGWILGGPGAGVAIHRLNATLDARLPRAVPIDVDLSTVAAGHRVLFLGLVGSNVDPFTTAPVGTPATVSDLVRAWPYAAMRLVRVFPRPT
ncbi:cell envelope integrity protein TolA [Roseisolibacter agri]|uniref:Uncharacterized protein n=1 Tax=Roseisolibacter agri TaxID=2014610 RepID=A0AA37QEJ8_9BACT|nr:hypothetical protein [Roseisolibacter agri]GLC24870.1 hypothetical protein rosag_13830 [Roseisolibacter agri]